MNIGNDLLNIFDDFFNKGYLLYLAIGLGIFLIWILFFK